MKYTRKNLSPFSGVLLVVVSSLPIWFGVGLFYAHNIIVGLPSIALGVAGVVYGTSCAIADTNHKKEERSK